MFPARRVRLIVPFGAGGATDGLARQIAAGLSLRWGQEVEIDNHPGDGAVAGTALAARAPPDGHTLLVGTSSTHCIAPVLRANLPYDADAFVPLSLAGWTPNLLLVPPDGPDSVAELLARARRRPGELAYASAGSGQTIHLCGALLGALTGTRFAHKPYAQGSMAGLEALMAGKVDFMCDNVLAALPYIQAGRVKALAVASALPCSALPGLPTMEQAGVPGYAAEIWIGVFAPPGTPAEAARAITHDLRIVLGHTDLVGALGSRGFMLDVKPGAEFAAEIADNRAQWREIAQRCGLLS